MSDFWKDQLVIVTGGCGFVGSHLVEMLQAEGANVQILDDGSRGQHKPAGVKIYPYDAANTAACERVFAGAFAVFNLAASVAGVTYNQGHHIEMFKHNLDLQTAPVLAAEVCEVPHFLQVSSVCVYGEDANAPARENYIGSEPTAANDGYSWSKRLGERVVGWSDLPHYVIVRPSNIFGPRDYFDDKAHVIPALIKKALAEGDTIEAYGTGREIREFLYVTDAARGMLHALQTGTHGEAYNLGSNGTTAVSIAQLIAMIQDIVGVNKKVFFSSEYDPGDSGRWSNAEKVNRLGWVQQVTLEEGLHKTISWYLEKVT
jgi:nucleoside-diphosphate-sugar epimerase